MKTNTPESNKTVEFGDFQTPSHLAEEVCAFLKSQGVNPKSVVEPTCGKGSFIVACLKIFESKIEYFGNDINGDYLKSLKDNVETYSDLKIQIKNDDFFHINWQKHFDDMPEPILVVGNPPWVTNSEIGSIDGTNLPAKTNFQGLNGFAALTGKSNFDISEWMLIHLLYLLQHKNAVVAMLCKTTVARKVLRHAWKRDYRLKKIDMYIIDAKNYFNVSVDACLLVCKTNGAAAQKQCFVYEGLSNNHRISTTGIHGGELLADIEGYSRWSHLDGAEYYKWRSGVKHDCAKIMEFVPEGSIFRNGLGEVCDLEEEYLYPLFKSSDVAKNEVQHAQRRILITQRSIKEDTAQIKERAPKTWSYLLKHADRLDKRKSSIYKHRPRFSIFGIGEYSFARWKVAISGLYKKIHFSVIGSPADKPAMVDDTCYFISCKSEDEAQFLGELLNSETAKAFLSSFIFWDSKRPITLDTLRRIDLAVLAKELGKKEISEYYFNEKNIREVEVKQALLF